MRVLHVPFTYFPSPCGGTEVYVAALCRELGREGVENVVAAPALSPGLSVYESVAVHRFAVDPHPSWEMIHADGDAEAARTFGAVLDQVAPDLVHFHARSPAVSILSLQEVRQRGLPAVYTYHTPTATCDRGSLMRWGKIPCDGELIASRCSACHLHHLGIPRPVAPVISALSPLLQHVAPCLPDRARWQFPARALPVTRLRHDRTRQWLHGMDAVIALNDWSMALLRLNGVREDCLHKVRHGLTQAIPAEAPSAPRVSPGGSTLRLAFLGRLDTSKGFDVILQALRLAPSVDVQVDAYTIIEDSPGAGTLALQQRLASEPRIRVRRPVAPAEVIATLRGYDALLVPSQWLETGPLVVLESLAAGLPVLGSGIGGIAEWIIHEENGLLLPHDDPQAWAHAIERLATDAGLLPRLRHNIRPPRPMRDVALDMLAIYHTIV